MMLNFKNKTFSRFFLATLLSVSLASCGSILDTGQDKVPDNIFYLEPFSTPGVNIDPVTLFLDIPTHPAYLNTFKIAVKPGGQEINYLAGARWSDNAPNLISRYFMVSLENLGQFIVLTQRQPALPHQFRLVVDVRDFSAHVGAMAQPRAVVEIEVNFLDGDNLEIIATRNFLKNISASENSKAAIARAFQQAMDEIVVELDDWLSTAK
jgi:cholesterol transport system auxiliary component